MSLQKKSLLFVNTLILVEEECAALGAALLDSQQATQMLQCAHPDDFGYVPNRLIFEAMRLLGSPLDCPTLAGELQRLGVFEQAGGWAYITGLEMGVVTAFSMTNRLRRLRELAHLRRLVVIGEELRTRTYLVGANSGEIADSVITELSSWESAKHDEQKQLLRRP